MKWTAPPVSILEPVEPTLGRASDCVLLHLQRKMTRRLLVDAPLQRLV